ncbi:MAG: aldo/keto reductase [Candidatus Thorarchaeota archaeon]
MQYRKHNSLELSEIGIGCYALNGAYGFVDVQRFKKMIQHAYEMGVNFFDTAEGYGEGEKILGKAINSFREDVHIATKVGVREGIKPNLSESYIRKACDRSLKQLDTDYIDLYQVHFHDPATPVEQTIGTLDSLVREGKIRHYGVGHLPRHQVTKYCGKGTPFSILMELSAVTRTSREELLPLCKTYDVAGIAFSTTGRGILTGKYGSHTEFEPGDMRNVDPLFQRARLESALRIKESFKQLAQGYGATSVQMAIAWVLAQDGIVCALTGTSKIEHLEENLGASGLRIKRTDLNELEKIFTEEDKWLVKEEEQIIKSILSNPLPNDPQQAFTDLVYVLETSIDLELLNEETVHSTFMELWPLKQKLDQSIQPKLVAIQKKLKDLFS